MVTTTPEIRGEICRLTAANPGIALADMAAALLPFYCESHTRGTVRELAARGIVRTERASGRIYLYPVEADA